MPSILLTRFLKALSKHFCSHFCLWGWGWASWWRWWSTRWSILVGKQAGCIRKVMRGGVGEFLLCLCSLTSPQRPPWGQKKVAVVERWLWVNLRLKFFFVPFFLSLYVLFPPSTSRLYTFSPPTRILELSSLLLYVFPPGQLPRCYTFLTVCPKYFFVEFQDWAETL